jgi:hypothetical protein
MNQYDQMMKKLKSKVSYSKIALALATVSLKSEEVDHRKLAKPR